MGFSALWRPVSNERDTIDSISKFRNLNSGKYVSGGGKVSKETSYHGTRVYKSSSESNHGGTYNSKNE